MPFIDEAIYRTFECCVFVDYDDIEMEVLSEVEQMIGKKAAYFVNEDEDLVKWVLEPRDDTDLDGILLALRENDVPHIVRRISRWPITEEIEFIERWANAPRTNNDPRHDADE